MPAGKTGVGHGGGIRNESHHHIEISYIVAQSYLATYSIYAPDRQVCYLSMGC